MYDIKRTNQEIDEIINSCEYNISSKYPGMTYEQGIVDFFRWLVGEIEEHPYED